MTRRAPIALLFLIGCGDIESIDGESIGIDAGDIDIDEGDDSDDTGVDEPDSPAPAAKIAFVRGGNLWVMNADGSDQLELTNGLFGQIGRLDWSRDRQRIAFAARGVDDKFFQIFRSARWPGT